MSWSKDYKKSIDCGNPKGFSQKAHCAARKKRRRGEETKSKSPFSEQIEMDKMRYCKLCRKVEQRDECSYGPAMWDRYSLPSNPSAVAMSNPHYHANSPHPANESKDHEYSMARSELSTIVKAAKRLQKKMKKGEGEIEAWVQSKITKAADYIDTAADYVDSGEMNNEEVGILEGKRDGKSAKDKDYSLRDWFKGGGWVQAGGKYDGKPCAKQPGQKTKPFCRDADDRAAMSKDEREKRAKKKRKEDPNPNRKGKAKIVREETNKTIGVKSDNVYKTLQQMIDRQKLGGKVHIPPSELRSASGINLRAHFEPEGEQLDELWGKIALAAGAAALPYVMSRMKPEVNKVIDEPASGSGTLVDKLKQRRDAVNKALQKNSYQPEGELIDESVPYKVGDTIPPSATQTTRQKISAAGNKYGKKALEKEMPEFSVVEEKDACYSKVKSRYKVWPSAYASGALVKCRKVGADNWGNKSESYEFSNWRDEFKPLEIESIDIIKPEPIKGVQEDKDPCWDGYKQVGMKKKGGKMVPNCVKEGYSNWREELSEDWQKVNRKDKTDGLSQAAVDAYRRENPGSKLQTAVTEKKPKGKRAKRRANFCRRMKGMKSKLTSAKTARDPDSRINKALRRWNCN